MAREMGCAVERWFPATAVELDLWTSGNLVTALQPMTCRFCRQAERRLSRMATAFEERNTETVCVSDTDRLPGAVEARTLAYVSNLDGRVVQRPRGCGRARQPAHPRNPDRGPRCGQSLTTPCGYRTRSPGSLRAPGRRSGGCTCEISEHSRQLLVYNTECHQSTVLLTGGQQNPRVAFPFTMLLRGTRRERILVKRHVTKALFVCDGGFKDDLPARKARRMKSRDNRTI